MSERACGVRLHPAARLLRWMGRHAVGVCFLLIGVWLFRAVLAGADGISYDWQWYRVWRYLGRWTDGHFIPGPLLDGLGMTVRIALFGLALAVAAGLGAALLRLSPWPVARGMAHVYVGCLRNTPLLLQLFFVYFLFAPAIGVGPFGAAVLALGLFEGAYMAELFRAGLQSVPRAQWEAGISLGLGVWNTLRLVILPQAVRRMLPPLTSQLVSLIKDTSLVSAIAVADLTMQAQVLIADTFLAFEIWLIVAALYLALTLLRGAARPLDGAPVRLAVGFGWGRGNLPEKGFYLAPLRLPRRSACGRRRGGRFRCGKEKFIGGVMKKFFAVLMLAAALILPGLAQAKDAQTSMIDDVVKRGVLRVGFSSFVPWAMQDKNGEFVGFEIDVAKRLAKDLGVELQLVPTKWAGIIPRAAMAGKFDVIIGSIERYPRAQFEGEFHGSL